MVSGLILHGLQWLASAVCCLLNVNSVSSLEVFYIKGVDKFTVRFTLLPYQQ